MGRRTVGCDSVSGLRGWGPASAAVQAHLIRGGALVSAQRVRGLISLPSRAWHGVKAAPVPGVSPEPPEQTGEEGGKDLRRQHSRLSAVCSYNCVCEK